MRHYALVKVFALLALLFLILGSAVVFGRRSEAKPSQTPQPVSVQEVQPTTQQPEVAVTSKVLVVFKERGLGKILQNALDIAFPEKDSVTVSLKRGYHLLRFDPQKRTFESADPVFLCAEIYPTEPCGQFVDKKVAGSPASIGIKLEFVP